MRATTWTLIALLALPTIPFLAPAAASCLSTTIGQWSRNDVVREEVVGVGPDSLQVYVKQKDISYNCAGSYSSLCSTPVGAVTTPGASVPEVRVLGIVVVPATTLKPITVVGATSVPVSAAMGCLPGPYDAGVGVYWGGLWWGDLGSDYVLP